MPTDASAVGEAFDATVVVVEGDPERFAESRVAHAEYVLERAEAARAGVDVKLDKMRTMLASVQASVESADAAIDAAQAELNAARAALTPEA